MAKYIASPGETTLSSLGPHSRIQYITPIMPHRPAKPWYNVILHHTLVEFPHGNP